MSFDTVVRMSMSMSDLYFVAHAMSVSGSPNAVGSISQVQGKKFKVRRLVFIVCNGFKARRGYSLE